MSFLTISDLTMQSSRMQKVSWLQIGNDLIALTWMGHLGWVKLTQCVFWFQRHFTQVSWLTSFKAVCRGLFLYTAECHHNMVGCFLHSQGLKRVTKVATKVPVKKLSPKLHAVTWALLCFSDGSFVIHIHGEREKK